MDAEQEGAPKNTRPRKGAKSVAGQEPNDLKGAGTGSIDVEDFEEQLLSLHKRSILAVMLLLL